MKTLHVAVLTVLCAIVAALCAAAGAQPQTSDPPVRQQAQARTNEAPASQPAARPESEPLRFDIASYPRVDGSTSANPLGVLAACVLTYRDYLWVLDNGGNKRLAPVRNSFPPAPGRGERWRAPLVAANNVPPLRSLKEDYFETLLLEKTDHTGTDKAFVNVIQGKSDLALLCRKASDDEEALMKKSRVELVYQPVALDAFVFLLNEKNPLPGLTVDQIRKIYAGEIKLWEKIGWPMPNQGIHAYVRERNSGSQVTLERLVMRGKTIKAGTNMTAMSMMGPYNRLPEDQHGIGFTFYYYDKFMASLPGTKLAAIDGVAPSTETIASRKYPLVTEVYLVYRKGLDMDSAAGKLARWFLSDAGQRTVARSGYVPLRKIAPESPARH
ncbi:MAG: substrate-binding domain-containing protein [Planctomycetaceae bacterium]|nr:substrate-binding domain-containing protein [Planctomycetaceae bacterium]